MTPIAAREWPHAHDAEALEARIKQLRAAGRLDSNFYMSGLGDNLPALCQGDIVRWPAPFVFLTAVGQAATSDQDHVYWLICSNTCDLDRDDQDVAYITLAPVLECPLTDISVEDRALAKKYKYMRRFYLPPWGDAVRQSFSFVDFTQTLSVEHVGFEAEVVARLSEHAWCLLNCFFVRFLARADRRHVP